jgi:hypothetical protein
MSEAITLRMKDLIPAAAAKFDGSVPKAATAARLINEAVLAEKKIDAYRKDLEGVQEELKRLRQIAESAEAHNLWRAKREKEMNTFLDKADADRLGLIRDYEQKLAQSAEALNHALALIAHLAK